MFLLHIMKQIEGPFASSWGAGSPVSGFRTPTWEVPCEFPFLCTGHEIQISAAGLDALVASFRN
jgi:hypothetical protein